MEISFNVKDESAPEFFAKYSAKKAKTRDSVQRNESISPYYFMRDEIFLLKECGLKPGQSATFFLKDKGDQSKAALKNIYRYSVLEYDDVSVVLTLIDFRIEMEAQPDFKQMDRY